MQNGWKEELQIKRARYNDINTSSRKTSKTLCHKDIGREEKFHPNRNKLLLEQKTNRGYERVDRSDSNLEANKRQTTGRKCNQSSQEAKVI